MDLLQTDPQQKTNVVEIVYKRRYWLMKERTGRWETPAWKKLYRRKEFIPGRVNNPYLNC